MSENILEQILDKHIDHYIKAIHEVDVPFRDTGEAASQYRADLRTKLNALRLVKGEYTAKK